MTQQCDNGPFEIRPIPGYEGYFVSRNGDVFSRKARWSNGNSLRKKIASVGRNGYLTVTLCKDGREDKLYVHALVLRAFVGLPARGQEALHRNGVRLDNRATNLRWGTRKENVADAIRHGTATIGHRNKQAKFNLEQIAEIRATSGREFARDVAERYAVSKATIDRVRAGVTYK